MAFAQRIEAGLVPRPPVRSAGSSKAESAPVAPLDFALVDTLEGLANLETCWNALFERAGQPAQMFQNYHWCRHWADHFLTESGSRRLAIVTGHQDGRLVMLWPLVLTRVCGLKELSWLGEPVSQYGDVLVEAGPDRAALLRDAWRFIAATLKPDLVRLNKTRADAVIAPLLTELGAWSAQQLEAPYLDLKSAPTWAVFEQRYPKRSRRNRQRQFRRLEDMGPVTFGCLSEGPEAAALARQAIEMKRSWLAAKGLVSPAISDPRTLRFFEAAANDTARPSGFRVSVLRCGGQVAALEIGLASGDRLAIHVIVYDPAFEKAAAGALLLERSMKSGLEEGFAVYDLLAPGGGYKTEWTDTSVCIDDLLLPLTPAGRIYARGYLGFLRPRLKAAILSLLSRRRALQFALQRRFVPKPAPSDSSDAEEEAPSSKSGRPL